jgi:hypothetical protein
MLEKLEFQQVVEETLKVKRATRCMTMYQFVLAMVFALYAHASPHREGTSTASHPAARLARATAMERSSAARRRGVPSSDRTPAHRRDERQVRASAT